MDFVIDRSKWRCGPNLVNLANAENSHGLGCTELLNEQGYMCCLGQIACQLGVKKKDILNQALPSDIETEKKIPILIHAKSDSSLADKAVNINDSELPLAEKEQKLKSLFSKFKHKLTFKGKYKNDKKVNKIK